MKPFKKNIPAADREGSEGGGLTRTDACLRNLTGRALTWRCGGRRQAPGRSGCWTTLEAQHICRSQPRHAAEAALSLWGAFMKKMAIAATLAALMTLGACATAKTWQATGGSRADGTVRLSYEFSMFESPVVDEAQAQVLAAQRCAVWGYSGAEAFGGVTRQCTQPSSSGCQTTLVTKEFQCTGTGTPRASATIFVR